MVFLSGHCHMEKCQAFIVYRKPLFKKILTNVHQSLALVHEGEIGTAHDMSIIFLMTEPDVLSATLFWSQKWPKKSLWPR